MNIIIYTLIILGITYFLLKSIINIPPKKISKNLRRVIFFGSIALAILFAFGGKFILSLPLTLLSLAIVKLKGFSIFQLIGLFRLIQTLRRSGRFTFNQNKNFGNSSSLTLEEAYKILNLDLNKRVTKEDVNKAYINIQKKIHPDISPETSRLSMIVNEAKEIVLKNIS
ncbi:J domain-containing protein [Candidatus Pelagibacter sp.]|nr:J domain-containing protein [Candidatus Pelagibacter sp.]